MSSIESKGHCPDHGIDFIDYCPACYQEMELRKSKSQPPKADRVETGEVPEDLSNIPESELKFRIDMGGGKMSRTLEELYRAVPNPYRDEIIRCTGTGTSLLGVLEAVSKFAESRLNQIINTPQTSDFIEAVKCEMVHQQQRWGDEYEKHPHDFALVLSYLQGKLVKAIFEKDAEKFIHHVITTAAVAGVIHKYFNLDSNTKRYFQ